jgi:leader peptidase (prepilin peptidase)/N-methyltransferase
VEVLGAAAAALAVVRHGLGGAAAAELAFVAALVALAFIDLDTWLLPHAITRPLIAAGVVASALGWSPAGGLAPSLAGAGLGFGAFAAVAWVGARVFRKEALGWGDVWLLAGIGAWLGARALVPVVLLASVQGSAFGIALLVLVGRAQSGAPPAATPPAEGAAAPAPDADEGWIPPRNAVPFGPFLALGALEWLYLAAPLADHIPVLGIFR